MSTKKAPAQKSSPCAKDLKPKKSAKGGALSLTDLKLTGLTEYKLTSPTLTAYKF